MLLLSSGSTYKFPGISQTEPNSSTFTVTYNSLKLSMAIIASLSFSPLPPGSGPQSGLQSRVSSTRGSLLSSECCMTYEYLRALLGVTTSASILIVKDGMVMLNWSCHSWKSVELVSSNLSHNACNVKFHYGPNSARNTSKRKLGLELSNGSSKLLILRAARQDKSCIA